MTHLRNRLRICVIHKKVRITQIRNGLRISNIDRTVIMLLGDYQDSLCGHEGHLMDIVIAPHHDIL